MTPAHNGSERAAPTADTPNGDTDHQTRGTGPTAGEAGGGAGGDVWEQGKMRVLAARTWVARHRPYYARALFSCPIAFTEKAETVSINGHWHMKANPHFTATLSVPQAAAVLIHEINHVLRDHHARSTRAGVADELFGLWKIAADCEINDDLRGDGLDMPDSALYPEALDLAPGRLAERYYRDLLEQAETPEDENSCSCGHEHGPPDSDGADGLDAARRELLRRQTAQDIIEHQNTHGTWTVPTGLRQWAQALIEPKIDWRRLLAAELKKGLHRRPGTGEATWARPPRRPDHGPVIRPGTARPTADVAVIIDTSGSMGDGDHARAAAETQQILTRAVPGEAVTVYSADHHTRTAQTITRTQQITLEGGGGTDMAQAIHTVAATRPRPAIIIVITDGHTPWPPTRPPGNTATVIAVLTRPRTADHVPGWITPIEACAPNP